MWMGNVRKFFGLLLLLTACHTSTPAPSGPPMSTWDDEQLGITWSHTPAVAQRVGKRVDLARQAGATWDRWSAFWFWLEQPHRPDPWGPGNFVFPGGDETFSHPDDPDAVTAFNFYAAAAGSRGRLETLIVLDGIARPYDCIAPTERGSRCYGSHERVQGLSLDPLRPDGSVNPDNHWASYVYHTVNYFARFGIDTFQVFSEPNLAKHAGLYPGPWNNGPDPDDDEWADDYARLVEVSLAAARAANPHARIVLAASRSDMEEYQAGTWLDRALSAVEERQLQHDLAAIAVHSYQYPVWTRDMVQWMRQAHPALAALPVWVTESGVPLCSHYAQGHACVERQEEQAAYVIQQYAYALTVGAERVFVHRLADDCEADFGLYDNDGGADPAGCEPGDYAPRAALSAAQVIAGYLQGGQFVADESLLPPAAEHARLVFVQPDQKVTALWATDQAVGVEIPLSETTCAYWIDQAGNWAALAGQSVFRKTLPAATARGWLWRGLPMVGGYVFLLIETDLPCPR